MDRSEMIKPKALKSGDTIGVVAPASPVAKEELLRGIQKLEHMGFRVKYHHRIHRTQGYLAGEDGFRADEINGYLADPEIKALFCARGGYGSLRLLDKLDAEAIKNHPKLFMGYSDITTLLLYLQAQYSLVVFHGPMVGPDFSHRYPAKPQAHLLQLLGSPEPLGVIEAPGIEILRKGVANGVLTGGCLSLVTLTIGTPWEINTDNKILFLEDIGEDPYKIDRMLSYLKLIGKFDKVQGLVFGRMVGCNPARKRGKGLPGREILEIIKELLQDFSIPIIYNFPSGHGGNNYALPFGVRVTLDGNRGVLIIEEGAVS